jgi:hypothetical protein
MDVDESEVIHAGGVAAVEMFLQERARALGAEQRVRELTEALHARDPHPRLADGWPLYLIRARRPWAKDRVPSLWMNRGTLQNLRLRVFDGLWLVVPSSGPPAGHDWAALELAPVGHHTPGVRLICLTCSGPYGDDRSAVTARECQQRADDRIARIGR